MKKAKLLPTPFLILLFVIVNINLSAQPIHMVTPYATGFQSGTELIKIEAKENLYNYSLLVRDGYLIITTDQGYETSFSLVNQTVRGLKIDIENYSDDFVITVFHPNLSASLIKNVSKSHVFNRLTPSIELVLERKKTDASVEVGSIIAQNSFENEGSFLENSGFHMDVFLSSLVLDTGNDNVRFSIFVTPRIGISSDQSTHINQEERTLDGKKVYTRFTQADILQMNPQIDLIMSLKKEVDILFSFEGGVSTNHLDSYVIPDEVVLGNSTYQTRTTFEQDGIDVVVNELNKTKHLYQAGAGIETRFRDDDTPRFYLGASIHTKQVLQRGFTFDLNSDLSPNANSLKPVQDIPFISVWRVKTGFDLGVFTFKGELISPFDFDSDALLFRIILSRKFPFSSK